MGLRIPLSRETRVGLTFALELPAAGLPALWGGEPGQVRKEAATAIDRKCRGSGSPPCRRRRPTRMVPVGGTAAKPAHASFPAIPAPRTGRLLGNAEESREREEAEGARRAATAVYQEDRRGRERRDAPAQQAIRRSPCLCGAENERSGFRAGLFGRSVPSATVRGHYGCVRSNSMVSSRLAARARSVSGMGTRAMACCIMASAA